MRVVAALAVGALVLAACGDSNPSSPTPDDLAEVDLSPDHTISVDEDGYEPAELEVAAGDVVLLVNEGDGPHSFTEDDRELDTGRLQPGEDTTMVLTEPGSYTFHDVEDPDHEATLVVAEPQ